MCLPKILLVLTFCYVATGFKNLKKLKEEPIYSDGYSVGRLEKKLEVKPSKFERWFTQHLDHFNPNDDRKWQQRYFVNDEFFNTTSRNVAFLRIAGEEEALADNVTNGAWYLYAKDFKPILFLLEHRYYGKSHPTENVSTENLVYLTSQQALADSAFFIDAMNKQHDLSSDVKWIVFGRSYSGCLSAWMRQKYPHLVHGAVSSSAPLLAKLDFPEYRMVVQDALRANSEECANAVKTSKDQIHTLLLHDAGQRNITGKFKLCDKIERNNPLDISNFYINLAGNFDGAVQYNHIRGLFTVEELCDIMTNKSLGMEVDRLAAVNSFLLEGSNQTCLDYKYDNMLVTKRNSSWTSSIGRQWTYQTCTEFGFFPTSTNKSQLFGDKFKLDFYVKRCQDIFGPKFDQIFLENAVKRTNVFYGGLDIEVNNVVFVHGSLDPWHVLGITQTKNNGAPVILIKGAPHCSETHDPSDDDTPQLKTARVQIKDIIASWLDL